MTGSHSANDLATETKGGDLDLGLLPAQALGQPGKRHTPSAPVDVLIHRF
jgi:hypothetical protein